MFWSASAQLRSSAGFPSEPHGCDLGRQHRRARSIPRPRIRPLSVGIGPSATVVSIPTRRRFSRFWRSRSTPPTASRRRDRRRLPVRGGLGLWSLTFSMATVPAAVLAGLMCRAARRFARRAFVSTLAVFFGSILCRSALSGMSSLPLPSLRPSWCFLDLTRRRPSLEGPCGTAVAVEYTAAIAVSC